MSGFTTEGIIFLIMAWVIIWSLTGFCLWKVLTMKPKDLEE